jgi:hypothetical protein
MLSKIGLAGPQRPLSTAVESPEDRKGPCGFILFFLDFVAKLFFGRAQPFSDQLFLEKSCKKPSKN